MFFRIKLRIPHEVAGGIAVLRAGLEALVVEVTKDPEYINQMDQTSQHLLNVIRQVSKPSAAGINLMASNQRYCRVRRFESLEQVRSFNSV